MDEPQGRIFVDWCPKPKAVMFVKDNETVVRSFVPPPIKDPVYRRVRTRQDHEMPAIEYKTIETKLDTRVIIRGVHNGGFETEAAYGWEPESRTVFISMIR